jgi:hypothetical protein
MIADQGKTCWRSRQVSNDDRRVFSDRGRTGLVRASPKGESLTTIGNLRSARPFRSG